METVIREIGIEKGVMRKRIFFIHPNKENVLKNAQSHFTKEQKKTAKLNHKNKYNK